MSNLTCKGTSSLCVLLIFLVGKININQWFEQVESKLFTWKANDLSQNMLLRLIKNYCIYYCNALDCTDSIKVILSDLHTTSAGVKI